MSFQIGALRIEQFRHLFGKDAATLAGLGIERLVVDQTPGYPCRVSLQDAEIGDTVLLLNFEHQPAATPYRASHAIYVREWADEADPGVDEVPDSLRIRLLSVRAFDSGGMMVDADVVDGHALGPVIERMFDHESVSYLHLHSAARGCYAARVQRS